MRRGYDVSPETFADDLVRERLGTGSVFTADVVPAVTMTFGRIEIDASGCVLSMDGGTIPGLYAAGATPRTSTTGATRAGSARTTVTGRRAGGTPRHAAAFVRAASVAGARP